MVMMTPAMIENRVNNLISARFLCLLPDLNSIFLVMIVFFSNTLGASRIKGVFLSLQLLKK